MSDDDVCPMCGAACVSRCPQCNPALGHRYCARGHQWHRCPAHGCEVIGAADHERPTYSCRCGRGESVAENDGEA